MKRIALLPNIFTTGNMVCGLSAILYCISALQTGNPEDFRRACWLIMLAILLDGLDGKIAVLTRSCSDFGVQYDSMADLISFGVAPAVLLTTHLQTMPGAGSKPSPICWGMTLILVVCVALRLARFNLQVFEDEKKSFEGLPSPTPAGFLALLLLSFHEYDYGFEVPPIGLFLIVILLGGLMVSHILYPSLKKSDFRKTTPLSTFLLVPLIFGLVVMEPVMTLLSAATGYILFGLIRHFSPESLTAFLARHSMSRKDSA
jgi:CDP-diacylglycerol--serine O-phosphatidyltransferase